MSSLMDRINQGMKSKPTPQPELGQEQVSGVLQARSGKAAAPGVTAAPQASSLLVDTAKQQASDKLRQIGLVGDIAKNQLQAGFQQQQQQLDLGKQQLAAQKEMSLAGMQSTEQQAAMVRDAKEQESRARRSADENMRLDVMQSQSSQRLRDLTTQRQITLDDIFSDFEMSKADLADRRDAARLEQIGFDMALSDRAYLDEIDRIGRERMLYNDLQFQQETARIQLGDDLDMLRDEMDWGRSFNADRRQWEIDIASISLDSALAIARADIKAANQRSMIEGAGKLVGAGVTYGMSNYQQPSLTSEQTSTMYLGDSNLQTENIG